MNLGQDSGEGLGGEDGARSVQKNWEREQGLLSELGCGGLPVSLALILTQSEPRIGTEWAPWSFGGPRGGMGCTVEAASSPVRACVWDEEVLLAY